MIALRAFEHFEAADRLCDAFRAGYETVRAWPEADPGTVAALRAARHLNILNFGLSVRSPGLDEFVARHAGARRGVDASGSAGLADGLGRRDPAQDLAGLGDALAADLARALVEHPVVLDGAAGQQPELHGVAAGCGTTLDTGLRTGLGAAGAVCFFMVPSSPRVRQQPAATVPSSGTSVPRRGSTLVAWRIWTTRPRRRCGPRRGRRWSRSSPTTSRTRRACTRRRGAAKSALEAAREGVAEVCGCEPREVVFTGGGSEADNLAVKGAAWAARERRGADGVVTTAIEHKAVLGVVRPPRARGLSGAAASASTRAAVVDLDALAAALDDRTAVVSVMLVNNETGIVQPLAGGRGARPRPGAARGDPHRRDPGPLVARPPRRGGRGRSGDDLRAQVRRPQGCRRRSSCATVSSSSR